MQAKERRTRKDRTGRDAILTAAMEEFLAHGYQNTRITEIVKKSGGSTRNIYQYFTDKRGLLLAALEQHSAGMVQRYVRLDPTNRTAKEYLQAFARGYLDAILEPQSMGFYRLVISEAAAMPELSRIVMRTAQVVVVSQIANYIESQIKAGAMKPCDSMATAEMFIALIRDKMLMRAAFDPRRVTSSSELDTFVEGAVQLFLEGLQTPAKA